MKLCPECQTGYHDSHVTCPTHGAPLHEIRELKAGMIVRRTYRIVRKLGQGGMGTVYLAEHTIMREPRALKFLAAELCEDEAFTERFRREAGILRKIRHRNVVDSGDLEPAEDDSLFFAMEYVEGKDLRHFLQHGPVDVALALKIIRGIAEGLGAAHALNVVHRDLKPENILMGSEGNEWVPKIADFGIVATREVSRFRTKTGGTLLSMPYAAPEQWRGMRASELDGRTDLYALGGILFEMLTGRTAFEAEGYEGWAEQHKNVLPPVPSGLRPEFKDWKGLDALVLKLLAKEREARPKDVAEVLSLLDAIQYLEPLKRVMGIAALLKRTETVAEALKQEPAVVATQHERETIAKIGIANRDEVGITEKSVTPTIEKQIEVEAPTKEKRRSRRWMIAAVAVLALGTLSWPIWNYLSGRHLPRTLSGYSGPVHSVAFSPDGRTLASGSTDRAIYLWDVASRRLLRTQNAHSATITSVVFSPDGRTLASGSADRTIELWDVASGQPLRTLTGHGSWVISVAFSPDGRTLASGSVDTTIKLWDVASGQLLRTLSGQGEDDYINSVAFSPDGRTLASGSKYNAIRLWDVASGQLVRTLRGNYSGVHSVAFSPDRRTLVSANDDQSIKLWDVASGQVLRTLSGYGDAVLSVAFSPDGRMLASGSSDNTAKLWDAASGQLMRTLSGHSGWVLSVAFSPDGRTLASGSYDTTIKLWDVSDLEQ